MVVDRAKLSSSEPNVAGPVGAGVASGSGAAPAILLGTNEDTRLLLRGLLRLYRHPVVSESGAAEELGSLAPTTDPTVLVLDAEAVTGGWEAALGLALHDHPRLRPILITIDRSSEFEARARAAGARVVLVRPFAIADFARALATATEAG